MHDAHLIAAPALPIAATANLSLGVVFALGTLLVAMLGLPPTRPARAKLIVVAASYAAGCIVGHVSLLAIAGISDRRRPARTPGCSTHR
jgi:hypothetical protein